VEQSPLLFVPLDFLIENLRRQGFNETREQCMDEIEKHPHIVKLVPTGNNYVVRLVV